MKLAQIITEAYFNDRIDLANLIRRDIAAGELSLARIARKFRVSKPRVTMIRKKMLENGWLPGQPPDGALKQRRGYRPPPVSPAPPVNTPMPHDDWMRS